MTDDIIVKEVSVKEVVKVNNTITEFDEPYTEDYFENRCKNKEHLIIVAYMNNIPVGYIVAYDRFDDGSFYCWMAGVTPKFRKKGILKILMNYQEKWTKNKGYNKIKIKTRNNRREMLSYLIKHGFNLIDINEHTNIEDYRLLFEKSL